MKPFSIAVDTAWKLAVREASAINKEFIEKEHAVIGLLSLEKVAAGKSDDMKLSREQWNSVRAEWSALQEVFSNCSLEASTLRRELRKGLGTGSYLRTDNVIHRSPECKAFFQIAAALAGGAQAVSALHLLAAIVGEPSDLFGKLLAGHAITPVDLKAKLLQRYGVGIQTAQEELKASGNPPAEFILEGGSVLCKVYQRVVDPSQSNDHVQVAGELTGQFEAPVEAPVELSATDIAILKALAKEARGRSSLLPLLDYTRPTGNYKKALEKLMMIGLIEMTIPDKPNRRLQKYQITEKGRISGRLTYLKS